MDIRNIYRSKQLPITLYAIGALIVLLVVLRIGIFIGFRQAAFSHRAFGERGHMPFSRFDDEFPQTHGGVGKITSVNLPSLTLQTPDGSEKIVLISGSTTIRRSGGEIRPQDLKTDDAAIILGFPDEEGVIEARFIRILPATRDSRQTATSARTIQP